MNKTELKAYAAELAQNLPEEKRAVFLEAFDDEKIVNAFVPRPDFSRALDERDARVKQYTEWYEKQAKPAYETNLKGIERLNAYEKAYGPLEEMNPREQHQAAAAAGLTKEELEKILTEKLAERDAAYVGLAKSFSRISQDHMVRFKEPLDVDAVEKFALEKGLPLDRAYNDYIAPRVEKARNEDIEARIKAAREEGAREARTRAGVPHDAKPSLPHPLFDQKHVKAEELPNAERAAKDAFFDGWNNPEPNGSASR